MESLYEDHLNAYESAISTKKALEEEIKNLRNNLDDKIQDMMKEYRDRENTLIWRVKEAEEAFAKFKDESLKELLVKDLLVDR